ncbi:MAG TPA: phosphonate C-P lyase system protein PhnL, partial [Xanthobacteraceae bacterium]|nr:phosphonate C-P lyase system protein PhnL [Xanthobacteraceae bacterium]
MRPLLQLTGVAKTFAMHLQDGIRLPVVAGVAFDVEAGECVALAGPSGAGKSSVLKMIFGNYRCDAGEILVRHNGGRVDVARADPRQILELRRTTIGYVSQFLRAVPRVPAIDVVAEPLIGAGTPREQARTRAGDLLARLNVPERLWMLPPATFSGGEQQRVNIARGFLPELPILLLDEPTASLDGTNRTVVMELINEKKTCGTAIASIVHDADVRARTADRLIDIAQFSAQVTQ